MELSAKDVNRAKYRLTKHRNRVHGGRGRGRGAPQDPHARLPAVQPQHDRYIDSGDDDDEAAGPRPRSEGLDLAHLLELAENTISNREVRHWTLMSMLETDEPPLVPPDVYKDVNIDLTLLETCFSRVPLANLLGIHPSVVSEESTAPCLPKLPAFSNASHLPSDPRTHQPQPPLQHSTETQPAPRSAGVHTPCSSLPTASKPSQPRLSQRSSESASSSISQAQPAVQAGVRQHSATTSRSKLGQAPMDDVDADLDALLALTASMSVRQPSGGAATARAPGEQEPQIQHQDEGIASGMGASAVMQQQRQTQPVRLHRPPPPPKAPPNQELEDWLDL